MMMSDEPTWTAERTIAALENRIAELKAELTNYKLGFATANESRQWMEAQLDAAEERIAELEAKNKRLKADVTRQMQIANDAVNEVERLRFALEPFARLPVSSLYDNQPPYDPGYVLVLAEYHQAPDLTREEILEAREALAGGEG